jgi:two-component system chemotaxis response regulator CheB
LQHLELKKLVLIGASTGGPGQIQKIIQKLPLLSQTSIIIAQHMADGFLESFTLQLQKYTCNEIILIEDDSSLKNGKVYLCKNTTRLNDKLNGFRVDTLDTNSYNPDINSLFLSIIPLANKVEVLCSILTGIGNDGVASCRELQKNGARCTTESKESAIIDGMPNRARELVPNIEVYDMDVIIEKISEFCN